MLPEISSREGPATRQVQRAAKAADRAEMAVFRYQLDGRVRAEKDQIDSECLSDALRLSLEEEIGCLNFGLDLAQGNPAALALVARKVEMQSNINNRRIQRRFS